MWCLATPELGEREMLADKGFTSTWNDPAPQFATKVIADGFLGTRHHVGDEPDVSW